MTSSARMPSPRLGAVGPAMALLRRYAPEAAAPPPPPPPGRPPAAAGAAATSALAYRKPAGTCPTPGGAPPLPAHPAARALCPPSCPGWLRGALPGAALSGEEAAAPMPACSLDRPSPRPPSAHRAPLPAASRLLWARCSEGGVVAAAGGANPSRLGHSACCCWYCCCWGWWCCCCWGWWCCCCCSRCCCCRCCSWCRRSCASPPPLLAVVACPGACGVEGGACCSAGLGLAPAAPHLRSAEGRCCCVPAGWCCRLARRALAECWELGVPLAEDTLRWRAKADTGGGGHGASSMLGGGSVTGVAHQGDSSPANPPAGHPPAHLVICFQALPC